MIEISTDVSNLTIKMLIEIQNANCVTTENRIDCFFVVAQSSLNCLIVGCNTGPGSILFGKWREERVVGAYKSWLLEATHSNQ